MKTLGNFKDAKNAPRANRLLMADPKAYEVRYAINVHMFDEDGQLKQVDTILAIQQWLNLKRQFELRGFPVFVVDSEPELPDLVFTANQSFPLPDGRVVLSKMKSDERRPEVNVIKKWFQSQGKNEFIQMENIFESMGDLIWQPGKELVWGGYGFRTEFSALEEFYKKTSIPVIPLKLVKDEFYHLDTCFSILNEDTLAFYPMAFDEEGISFIKSFFKNIIELDEKEATLNFAGNCYCPDGKHIFLQKGSEKFENKLRNLNFIPVSVETSEFIKGGGSVFCMKLPLFP